ncbi:unnamed protein product [Rhizoctonia solani]|uniref:Uncharacterized protein n=1 Tax=Rhizoctonia solani TaxID=456999 RepID=A0A8H3DQE0_9AGAM|nr:unnamed protein product [Rhizoctonia solani]
MSSELPATDYAEVPDSGDILNSLCGVCSVPLAERNLLTQVSPFGNRCVLTGQDESVKLAHLIEKCTKIRRYQFTFGRKLNLNSHWFFVSLASNLHHQFDTWKYAFIPTPALITRIANRLRDEKARRLQLGIQGPWPDYRQAGWFPITKAGIDYYFIPLGIHGTIFRHRDLGDPSANSEDFQQLDAPFEGFPTLRLSAHPYAMVLNAYPKLKKYLKTGPLPSPADSSYQDIKFIYHTVMNT